MDMRAFFHQLGERCDKYVNGGTEGCEECGMSKFCYTPPARITDRIIDQAIDRVITSQVYRDRFSSNPETEEVKGR